MKKMLPLLLLLITSIGVAANKDQALDSSTLTDTSIITIPVVVHIVYNTAQQNISDAQVISQLEALNKDYRGKNSDRAFIPSYYATLSGDAGIEFKLASVDPSGYSTTGIIRKPTGIQMFGTDDRIKSSAIGGDDPWNRSRYLNIWVCNLAGGLLGYTSKTGGPAEKDGVVIQYNAFGTIGAATAPFNLGRTATHEIGHWLNLIHIWGDSYCGNDEVDDTPKQRSSNRGRPTGEKFSCDMTGHGDMYMNFMDLTDDGGMFMFTRGQCKRMRALFNPGGQRYAILNSNALSGVTISKPVPTVVPDLVKQVSVFPNPASSLITIELAATDNDQSNTITIYNNIGQPVLTRMVFGNRVTVNVTSLQAGIYFIKTAKGDSKAMTKFVKR